MVYNANAVTSYENAFLNGGDTTRKTGSDLGKDEFLKLMIAQMQNQDPLEPQSDSDFIAQMAQFSSLEQMLNMNNTMQLNSAIGLIGSSVEWTDDKGNLNIGVVTSARMYNGKAQVMVGDTAIDMEKVKMVTNDGTPVYAATALIGSQINWLDADNNLHTGVVESVKVVNNYPLLVVGDALVDVNSVISVKPPQEEYSKETTAAMEMIGRNITWKDAQGEEYTGLVYGVQLFDGAPYLVISDGNDKLTYVPPSAVTASSPGDAKVKEALSLIGKMVTGTATDNTTQTGYVNSVKYIDKTPYLVVGNALISLDNYQVVNT